MKAISLRLPWSLLVATGEKTVEYRAWKTSYRGDILICTSKYRQPGSFNNKILGHAVCIARLEDCLPFTKEHLSGACMEKMPAVEGFALMLKNIRPVMPVPVKGRLMLFNVDLQPDFLPYERDDLLKFYIDNGWIGG